MIDSCLSTGNIRVAQHLQVGFVLDELLGAAVQQPDVWVALLDGLSAQLQHQAQHAVGRRVLGAEVDGQVGHVLLCRGIFVWRKNVL